MLSTVQNLWKTDDVPSPVARGLFFDLERRRKKRTTFLAGNQVDDDDRATIFLSFSLFAGYASIYLLSLLSSEVPDFMNRSDARRRTTLDRRRLPTLEFDRERKMVSPKESSADKRLESR